MATNFNARIDFQSEEALVYCTARAALDHAGGSEIQFIAPTLPSVFAATKLLRDGIDVKISRPLDESLASFHEKNGGRITAPNADITARVVFTADGLESSRANGVRWLWDQGNSVSRADKDIIHGKGGEWIPFEIISRVTSPFNPDGEQIIRTILGDADMLGILVINLVDSEYLAKVHERTRSHRTQTVEKQRRESLVWAKIVTLPDGTLNNEEYRLFQAQGRESCRTSPETCQVPPLTLLQRGSRPAVSVSPQRWPELLKLVGKFPIYLDQDGERTPVDPSVLGKWVACGRPNCNFSCAPRDEQIVE